MQTVNSLICEIKQAVCLLKLYKESSINKSFFFFFICNCEWSHFFGVEEFVVMSCSSGKYEWTKLLKSKSCLSCCPVSCCIFQSSPPPSYQLTLPHFKNKTEAMFDNSVIMRCVRPSVLLVLK